MSNSNKNLKGQASVTESNTSAKENSKVLMLIIGILLGFILALILYIFMGKSTNLGPNQNQPLDSTRTQTATPISPSTETTTKPTSTNTPTTGPTYKEARAKFTNELNQHVFEFIFNIPETASISSIDTDQLYIKFADGSKMHVQLLPEGYIQKFSNFKEFSTDHLGNVFAIKQDSSIFFSNDLTKVGECQALDEKLPAPCGGAYIALEPIEFLAGFSVDAKAEAQGTHIMKTLNVRRVK